MQSRDLVLEVQDELGNNRVRCLAMGSTDGLVRGAQVTNTGSPITVPVGEGTLGRIFNVLGQAIDSTNRSHRESVLADPPRRAELRRSKIRRRKIFETGIKVID